MILVWNDAQSFHRHLEAMKTFRQSHGANAGGNKLIKDMPTLFELDLPRRDKVITCFTDSRGKLILVPIWKITISPSLQN